MRYVRRLVSVDGSVNFVWRRGFESRMVLRQLGRVGMADYGGKKLCVYVSSHGGCNMRCGQCHLTATGQTRMPPAKPEDFAAQVEQVMGEAKPHLPEVARINIEFMARGEPLANPYVWQRWPAVSAAILGKIPSQFHRGCNFNISTIFPRAVITPNEMTFATQPIVPRLYYSAWSIQAAFKDLWMPGAIPTEDALRHLAGFQKKVADIHGSEYANTRVIVHGAFVKGQNDCIERDVRPLLRDIHGAGLYARFNIVRYNPPPVGAFSRFVETPTENLMAIRDLLAKENPAGCKLIDRIGPDVYASCGTFHPPIQHPTVA